MTLRMSTALVLSWYSRVTYMHRYLVDSHTHLGFHKHHDLVKSRHTGRPNTFVIWVSARRSWESQYIELEQRARESQRVFNVQSMCVTQKNTWAWHQKSIRRTLHLWKTCVCPALCMICENNLLDFTIQIPALKDVWGIPASDTIIFPVILWNYFCTRKRVCCRTQIARTAEKRGVQAGTAGNPVLCTAASALGHLHSAICIHDTTSWLALITRALQQTSFLGTVQKFISKNYRKYPHPLDTHSVHRPSIKGNKLLFIARQGWGWTI